MDITARARLALVPLIAACLSACVYAPIMQSSHAFAQHPGVFLQVWGQSDYYYGTGSVTTRLVNNSNVDKCVWTAAQPARLLRVGETWQFSDVQSPGNVTVANVVAFDPNCVNAKTQGR